MVTPLSGGSRNIDMEYSKKFYVLYAKLYYEKFEDSREICRKIFKNNIM